MIKIWWNYKEFETTTMNKEVKAFFSKSYRCNIYPNNP